MSIDMHKVNTALIEASDTEREADASLYGYFYQVDQTLMRVLKNKNSNKIVLMEVLEDILEYGSEEVTLNGLKTLKPVITAYQIKHHNTNVTNSTAYKPLLLGFISYQRVKNELKKIEAQINNDYIYRYKIVYGIPSDKNISVNKPEAWESIIQCVPFETKYKNFASIWEANVKNKILSNYNQDDINEYLACTEIDGDSELKDYSEEVVSEIENKIRGVEGLEKLASHDLYYIMWSIIKEFMLERDSKKKGITFDDLTKKTKTIVSNTFGEVFYKDIYYLEKIKSLIHNDLESILYEIYERTIDDNEEIYYYYSNCYSKIIESFIINKFDNCNYRFSFLNSLVPEDYLKKADNLVDEYKMFMENNVYIISYLRILLKIAFYQNLNTESKIQEIFKIDKDMWNTTQLDERGHAILISFKEDMTDNKIGHIANKMNKIDKFPDVWYMKNCDDYCGDELYDYKVDITRPKINTVNECKAGIPSKVFTIECMKCLNMKDFTDITTCKNIHKKGCVKSGKK
ncbi:hypothetical protein [Clostridium intestinale]|uniref:Uncharacterized protein n=1 Tax=Clostridium intestinale TaxID=36845 RepID=A0A7D6ZW92_9CLOT|nr:hypothetical protein [Clostridium intestinale]QLY78974.1 hypothetical protein HZF06_18080 [Clostridium intestinale]